MACEHQAHGNEEGVSSAEETLSAGTNSAWIRRQLSDSIYIWACGEKADAEDEDPKLSDRLIGWLILFMQGFAYAMLIFLARPPSQSDAVSSADDGIQSSYLLPSVVGAMYLLVASTTHDLRAGFSLLVGGDGAGHRAFGVGLLIVYGIMISAAMKVLVSTSDDTASVVLNAVTVLFVADLDEKAIKFLLTVPQKWRLFWAIQSIGISFALALIAIAYTRDATPLLEGSKEFMQSAIPNWGFWIVTPAAVTWCSFRLSSVLRAVCDYIEEDEGVGTLSYSFVISRYLIGAGVLIKGARERIRDEPWFYAFLVAWLAQGVGSWLMWSGVVGFPVAVTIQVDQSANEYSLVLPHHKYTLVVLNVVLVTGLVMKLVGVFPAKHYGVTTFPKARTPSRGDDGGAERDKCAESRVPSLLVGWGVGYWVTSLLFLLASSWHGDGWTNAPIVVTGLGYVVLPLFLITASFMVADANFLGKEIGAFVEPIVAVLKNRRLVIYWVLATILRDVVNLWMLICMLLDWAPPI